MKMNKKILLMIFSLGFIFTSCGGSSNSDNSSDGNVNSSTQSEETSIFTNYVSLQEAFENTDYYVLAQITGDERAPTEVYLKDMYYNGIHRQGYVELENDKGYLHAFSTYYTSDDIIKTVMEVYGRNTVTSNILMLKERTIMPIIEKYINTFFQRDDNVYFSRNTAFIYEIADFLQGKIYNYATEIEIKISQDDRLESINIIESGYSLFSADFKNISYKELPMYKYWVDEGAKIEERIYDYKNVKESGNTLVSVYEGEEVEFEATVVARDVDGNIYVAKRNDEVGHIGIKINANHDVSMFNLKDIVKVSGKIATENFNAYLTNATVEDTGEDAKYAPYFDEEALVDSMGGGIYAAGLFANYPYFNDSLYSTYAYVNNMPANFDSNDTRVDLICPMQSDGTLTYHMEIIIPDNLSGTKKQELFEALSNAKTYSESNAYELSIERFLIKFDMDYTYRIKLMATEDSFISKRLNSSEKIEKYMGLSDFPLPIEKETVSYKFGGFTNQFLESEYGITTSQTDGLFVGVIEVYDFEIEDYFESLVSYGAEKYDEIKDAYTRRHIIYTIGDVNIDIVLMLSDSFDDVTIYTINMWLYKGDLIEAKNIFERLDEKIGSWFDVNNFLKHTGTYDADYTIYELRTYAGKFYDAENPLYCVAVDTQEMIFDDYNSALVEMGYKVYRVGNKPYTYKTRGQTHYVFYKDDVYLDVSTYHTSDYTYSGHNDFEYRLEILIYKGEVMSVDTYSDLSPLSDLYKNIDESLAYYPELPSDAVVEVWRDLNDFTIVDVDYGYGSRDEAFVYTSDVEGAYEACKTAILAAGYEVSGSERENSILFNKIVNGNHYNILLLKETEKGYLRVFNDIGGVDFLR